MKLYPEIILSAKQNGQPINGYRVWFIAKDYCKGRRGSVPVKVFRAHLKGLGLARATYSRWIAEALETGLIRRYQSKRKGLDYYSLAGWYAGAALAGCSRLHNTPAAMDLNDFAGQSWISLTWAAYELRFNGKPISRTTLKALTGVPYRTQQYREKKAKVKQINNYGIYGDYGELAQKNPDFIIGIYEQPGVFINEFTGELCQQLPNSRAIPEGIQPAKRGRTRKVNKLLSALFNRDAEAKKQPFMKRYSNSHKETRSIKAKLKKRDDLPGMVTIYERWKALPGGAQGWAACML